MGSNATFLKRLLEEPEIHAPVVELLEIEQKEFRGSHLQNRLSVSLLVFGAASLFLLPGLLLSLVLSVSERLTLVLLCALSIVLVSITLWLSHLRMRRELFSKATLHGLDKPAFAEFEKQWRALRSRDRKRVLKLYERTSDA